MAQDGLTCDYCSRPVGNAGAKAQHERSCPENPANQEADEPGDEATRRDRRPATPQTSDRQLQRSAEADVGDALIRVADTDLPASERMNGARRLLGFAVDLADTYNQYRERKMEEQEMRAQRVELGDPEKLPFPTCKNCDYQFSEEDIPLNANKVRCPECTTLYPIVERTEEEIESEVA